jgi:hypothetical protein
MLKTEEFCHGNVKQQIKNATPVDKYELLTIVNRSFARLRHRPDLILSFFRQARNLLKLEHDEKSGGYIIKSFVQED